MSQIHQTACPLGLKQASQSELVFQQSCYAKLPIRKTIKHFNYW